MKKPRIFFAPLSSLSLLIGLMLLMDGCGGCGGTGAGTGTGTGGGGSGSSCMSPSASPMIKSLGTISCAITARYYGSQEPVSLDFAQINRLQVCDTVMVDLMENTVSYVLARRDTEVLFSVMKLEEVGDPSGYAILVYRGGNDSWDSNGVVIGDIYQGGESYELRKCRSGNYVLGKVDPAALINYGGGPHQDPFTGPSPPTKDCQLTAGNGVIDLLILYTAEARDAEGGIAEVEAKIILAMQQANEVFLKKDVKARLHFSQIGEYINYPIGLENPAMGMQEKLNIVIGEPQINELRDAVSADLTIVFVSNGDSSKNGYSSKTKGTAVLKVGLAPGNYLLAHEIGHLLIGDKHDNQCFWTEDSKNMQGIWTNEPNRSRSPIFKSAKCDPGFLAEIEAGAQDVSAYRCPNLVPQALIQDYLQDNGQVVDAHSTGVDLLFSPHIYVRNSRDTNLTYLYMAENLDPNEENYLYIMVRNGSDHIISGSLRAYVYSQHLTPVLNSLQLVDTVKNILIPPASIKVLEIKIPVGKFYDLENCGLLAQWHSQEDTTYLSGSQPVLDLVRESNRVAARAAWICNLSTPNPKSQPQPQPQPQPQQKMKKLAPCDFSTSIPFKKSWGDQFRLRFTPSQETDLNFMDAGGSWNYKFSERSDSLNSDAMRKKKDGSLSVLFRYDPSTIPVDDQGDSHLYLRFCPPASGTQDAIYPVHLELLKDNKVVGAYTYLLKTSASSL